MTIEQIDKQLTHPNVKVTMKTLGDERFERIRELVIDGQTYTIEWWQNISYLRFGGLLVIFDSVKQTGTWPNSAKMNLQFYDDRGELCAVLPIEYYKREQIINREDYHAKNL